MHHLQNLDRKQDNQVTWAEFLTFLSGEGQRREKVLNALLYGNSIQRLKQKARHRLLRDSDNSKATEYNVTRLMQIPLFEGKYQLVLAVFENSQVRLMDSNQGLQDVQIIEFQTQEQQLEKKSLAQSLQQQQISKQSDYTDMHQSIKSSTLIKTSALQKVNIKQHFNKTSHSKHPQLQQPHHAYSDPNIISYKKHHFRSKSLEAALLIERKEAARLKFYDMTQFYGTSQAETPAETNKQTQSQMQKDRGMFLKKIDEISKFNSETSAQ